MENESGKSVNARVDFTDREMRIISFDKITSEIIKGIYETKCNGNLANVRDLLVRLNSFKGAPVRVRALRDGDEIYESEGLFSAGFFYESPEDAFPAGFLLYRQDQMRNWYEAVFFDRLKGVRAPQFHC